MSGASVATWQEELGLAGRDAPTFVRSKQEIDPADGAVPHAHQVRRAFDLLGLDGALCEKNAPLVYFKTARRPQDFDAAALHKQFWNHGGAPILVVILPKEVQVYSSFIRPEAERSGEMSSTQGLVLQLQRASDALREFLSSVESGEFFRQHARYFDPAQRVDQTLLDNLQAARENLREMLSKRATEQVLDSLLCRLVFTCYLFDREVIGEEYLASHGLPRVPHLCNILSITPRSKAKEALYELFHHLAEDFNGDLFSDDLNAESRSVTVGHIDVLDQFFQGTNVSTGQGSLWRYDFRAIPIETISAIYERFLTRSDKASGAFYTPRFLAELVLDIGLADRESLLGMRVLDPACGSGIFLVGFFNRIAEQWARRNPHARNDRRARELMELLQSSVFGVDLNPTACRIAAFSLYLAYLDQLSPRDIQLLQEKGRALPRLIGSSEEVDGPEVSTIWCGDFFESGGSYPERVDLVVGNPPWGSTASSGSPASEWCREHERTIPDRQIASAFMWKAATHVGDSGRVCFVLPHGTLFNHSGRALAFQRNFLRTYRVERVLNLTDYQSFLFSEARHPALVLTYGSKQPEVLHTIDYWAPRVDWKVTRAEIITVSEQDREVIPLSRLLADLQTEDAPQIWKRMTWATPRDRRLLDRLADMPRLRERVRQPRDNNSERPWLIGEGFQPLGENDDPEKAVSLRIPPLFVKATSPGLRLCLLEDECERRAPSVRVRARSNKVTEVFEAPHVLVSQGFGRIAFADFAVSFQHALRGIAGPESDRELLMFLAAYLRSPLARYYLFHTSSNWGVSRQKVHVEELLRLPFPTGRSIGPTEKRIVRKVARLVEAAASRMREPLVDCDEVAHDAQQQANELVYEYFDLTESERVLVEETASIFIPSFRPTRTRRTVPAIERPSGAMRHEYLRRLCDTLNGWIPSGVGEVVGTHIASETMGIGLAVLTRSNGTGSGEVHENGDLLRVLDSLRRDASLRTNTFELMRGVKLFRGDQLFIVKQLSQRYWSQTAALNDADEIAGSILMHGAEAYA